MMSTMARIPQAAVALGYAGSLPFIITATVSYFPVASMPETAIWFLVGFGAVLLSFMGGVRWGIGVLHEKGLSLDQLAISVVPPVIGWVTLLLGSEYVGVSQSVQLGILIVTFAVLLVDDLILTRRGIAPDWYPGLRIPLTAIVEISLLAALARIAFFTN